MPNTDNNSPPMTDIAKATHFGYKLAGTLRVRKEGRKFHDETGGPLRYGRTLYKDGELVGAFVKGFLMRFNSAGEHA